MLNCIKNIDKIILIDIQSQASEGETLDVNYGISAISETEVHLGTYEDCRDSDIIIIAGKDRKPRQTRNDLLYSNQKIISEIMK